MDDTLRNIALGLFALLGLNGGLHERVRLSAERQVSDAFAGIGQVHAVVAPRGVFGLELNDLYEVDINATGMRADHIPFYVYPRSGWKGSIRYLRLRLRNFVLRNIPIREFRAEIPHATYDLGHAFYRNRLVLRGAGVGHATVTLGAEGLVAFIRQNKRYQQTLSDVKVLLSDHIITVTGNGSFPPFGTAPFIATGVLKAREGRFLDLDPTQTEIRLSGIRAPNSLLNLINPVVDIEEDLGLKGYFRVDTVAIIGEQLVVTGSSTLAVAPIGAMPP